MRIGFLGDRHVSSKSPRYATALQAWDAAIDDALAAGATAFVGLGDVNEGLMDGDELTACGFLYLKMKSAGPVFEVLGNHEALNALRWLRLIGVEIADNRVVTALLPTAEKPEAVLLLVPYPRRGHPPFDGLPQESIEGSMRAAAERIGAWVSEARAAHPYLPLIVAGHWTVETMRTGASDYELHGNSECIVPIAALAPADLVLCGHIHKAQTVSNIVGVGSLYRCSFAEAAEPKSYVLVTVDGSHVTWERRPLPALEMQEVEIRWPGTVTEGFTQEMAALAEATEGREIKLFVTVPEDLANTFDPSVFEVIRGQAAHFALERATETSQRTRAPEIDAAATLVDEFKVYVKSAGVGVDDVRMKRLIEKVEMLP